VAQAALGHKAFARIEGVYNVYAFRNERREMFQRWADLLLGSESKPAVNPPVPAAREDPPAVEVEARVRIEGAVEPEAMLEITRERLELLLGPMAKIDTPVVRMPAAELFEVTEGLFLRLLGATCHSKEEAALEAALWEEPESTYREEFLAKAVLDRRKPAAAVLKGLWHFAMTGAQFQLSVMTHRAIREQREPLERDQDGARRREARYREEVEGCAAVRRCGMPPGKLDPRRRPPQTRWRRMIRPRQLVDPPLERWWSVTCVHKSGRYPKVSRRVSTKSSRGL
jgi:hypothetical protein